MLSALSAGGQEGAVAVSSVLDHAIDALEHLAVSSPRKSRRGLRDLLERAEALADSVDPSWADGVASTMHARRRVARH